MWPADIYFACFDSRALEVVHRHFGWMPIRKVNACFFFFKHSTWGMRSLECTSTGWSKKSLCAPDVCTVIVRCTETFWSPCICHRRRSRDCSCVWMGEYSDIEQSSCLIIFIIFVNLVGCLSRVSTPVYQLRITVIIVSVRQVSCSEIRRCARSDVVIHWCN